MTVGLNANQISWNNTNIDTLNVATLIPKELSLGLWTQLTPINLNNLTPMPIPGRVVGLILHCETNTDNNDEEVVFVKGQAGPVFSEYAVKVIIPSKKTGFFYSESAIPEFDRKFSKGDHIGVRIKKTVANNPGMTGVTLLAAVEIQFPPTI